MKKEPWTMPADALASASVVVDETGVHKKTAPIDTNKPSTDRRPLSKTWRVSLIQLNRVAEVEEGEHGVLDGLKEAGLVEGRDFRHTIKNAQGDMATVSGLIDAASADSDLLITFSTPTLQAALRRAQNVPVVFNYVANGIKAGAGKSNTDHAPNVTGVSLLPANDEALSILKTHFPAIRKLGTLYCPAETNMVHAKNALDETNPSRPTSFDNRPQANAGAECRTNAWRASG